ncbi:Hsp70 family protein [Dactylosporangium siamense]|uniref:Hsp70 family protein n=1 Tax=Dactylosporangium siamense TaxID=685454 RepID=UPI0036201E2F
MLRLGIDLGTSTTVGCLRRGDGPVSALLFDASPLLPSAVFAGAGGQLLTGADAARSAGVHPAAFEPSPKQRIDDDTVWLGDRAVPVVELLTAVLRRVLEEARRVGGDDPAETVLTCPAAWSRTRLAVLASAARGAGLGDVKLIREPVAAAGYFASVLGATFPPGKCLVVYDFGAGTFDVSVVRQAADGVEVLAADGLADVGGADLDAVVVARLRDATAGSAPEAWHRLDHPVTTADQRARRFLWLDARATKEQLSRHASADVHIPLVEVDAHVTREEFEQAARGHLDRTVALTLATVQAAGVPADELAGVLLVGGSSRIPLAAQLLHRALGVAPTVIEQPELVVAYGSLHATTELPTSALPAAPSRPPASAPAMASPTSAPPVSTPPAPAPPVSTPPTSAPPFSARPAPAPPVSARPAPAPPVSARPASTPPVSARPASAPPVVTPPVSSPPTGVPIVAATPVKAPLTGVPAVTPAPPATTRPTTATTSRPAGPSRLTGPTRPGGPSRPTASPPAVPAVPARRRSAPLLAGALVLLVLIATGLLFWSQQRGPRGEAETGSGAGPAISVPASADPTTAAPTTPGPTVASSSATNPVVVVSPTGGSTARPVVSVERGTPGCQETDSRVQWRAVRGDVTCAADATALKKQVGWDDGFLRSYAELRMSLSGQRLPEAYTVSFAVGRMAGPETTSNRSGCGGVAVHTTGDGTAYEYVNVCGDGWIELVKVNDNTVLENDHWTDQVTPGSGFYAVTVVVTASSVTVTVNNRAGDSRTVSSPAGRASTAFISLLTTWRNVGATASFTDFAYRPS